MPSQISVYDALLISPELRRALVQAIRDATHDHSLLAEVAEKPLEQTFNVSFTDDDKLLGSRHHERPLYMVCKIDGTLCNKVLVDPGSSISIMNLRTLHNISLDVSHLTPMPINIQGFNAKVQTSLGAIILPIEMGGYRMEVKFHVINADTSYKALLGRPWLHEYGIVPSTLHQCIKFVYKGEECRIDGDTSPFHEGETHFTDAKYYLGDETTGEITVKARIHDPILPTPSTIPYVGGESSDDELIIYHPPKGTTGTIQVGADSDDEALMPVEQTTCVMRLPHGLFKDMTPTHTNEVCELKTVSVPPRTNQEERIIFHEAEIPEPQDEDMAPPEPADLRPKIPEVPPYVTPSLRELFDKVGCTQYQTEEIARFFDELWDRSRCRINSTRGLGYPPESH